MLLVFLVDVTHFFRQTLISRSSSGTVPKLFSKENVTCTPLNESFYTDQVLQSFPSWAYLRLL